MIHSHRGSLFAFVGLCAAVLGTGTARVARVVDVRVGVHADHTRVVIELDAPSGHRVERQEAQGDRALAVHVEARAERRRIVSNGPLVEAVTVEPGDGAALARIALREPGLGYSEMLLDAPPRIVIDIRRPALAAAPRVRGEEVDAAPPATAFAALGEAAVSEHDPFVPPASYRELVEAQQAAAAAVPPAPPARAAEPADEPPPVAAAAAPSAVVSPPASVSSPPPRAMPSAAPAAEAPDRSVSSPRQGTGLSPAVDGLIVQLRSRLAGFDLASAMLVLAALAAALIVYRRLSARRTRAIALGKGGDLAIFGDASPLEAASETEPAVPAWDLPLDEETPPRAGAPALTLVAPEEDPREGWQSLAIPPAELVITAAFADSDASPFEPPDEPPDARPDELVAALEQRMARLESRIEELLESRERLERYAAAQNEELRVQRAAIARTQRVLRGLVRPEDQTAEAELQQAPAPPGD